MNSLEIIDKKDIEKRKMTEIIEKCKTEIRTMTEEEQVEFDAAKSEIVRLNEELDKLNQELKKYDNSINEVEEEEKRNLNKNNTQKLNKQMEFRLLKTINDIANNRSLNEEAQAYINAGIDQMKRSGQNYGGQIVLPLSEKRGVIAATVDGAGAENVAEDKLGILEALRDKLVLSEAGAQMLSGLVGNVSIPAYSGSNVTWEGENAAASDGAGSFSEVKLEPKRITAYLDISKQFLIQDSNSAEAMLKNDLVSAIADKLEATILGDGTGSTTIPKGIFSTVTPLTGATNTFAKVVAMEEGLEGKNYGEKVWIVNPKAKSIYKTTAKATNGAMIMEGAEMDGYKVLTSNKVPANGVVFGAFNDLVIGQWGGIDLTVDPYTKAAEGKIRLVINAYFDAKPRRVDSFVTAKTV